MMALRFGFGLDSVTRFADRLAVGLDVEPTLSERHDVIPNCRDFHVTLRAEGLLPEEPVSQLLQAHAADPGHRLGMVPGLADMRGAAWGPARRTHPRRGHGHQPCSTGAGRQRSASCGPS